MITGILYIVALLLGSLVIFITNLSLGGYLAADTANIINGLLFFIGALLAAIALLSYALHPDLDEGQRLIFAIFLVLLILVFFNAGVNFSVAFI
jgi:hypothetical protein